MAGDTRPGAGIVLQAGMNNSMYAGLLQQYLNPALRADASQSLAGQPGRVVHSYEGELMDWLRERYGVTFSGDDAVPSALAYFQALPAAQQRIFARDIYFAELREGGREYNDEGGPRSGSYLRGRRVIQALFPELAMTQQPIVYDGSVLLFGGAGVHTNQGGDIQMLAPGGGLTFGVEGPQPPSTAGVITRGQGNIQLYSRDSILLGQSRVMTSFGGDILAWANRGDINAGRGSKTTVVYTPPLRVYDSVGNVRISPDVPSTGAGIATLAPIPEVPAGDVDLIAPEGVIDAGEAGIRVSGNVNVAALQVINSENIKTQGESKGIPVVAAVNTGALTSASAAASSATAAAQDVVQRNQAARQQNQPSIVTVQILGFGGS
ncbi:filamentous hemagglutinin family protein [Alcaligenes sp. Marseille-Q7550]